MSCELDLRVSLELKRGIARICAVHRLDEAEFCRKAARQYYSGKIKTVRHHKLLKCSTYNGSRIQSRKWDFDLKGKELTAVLVAAIIKLEGIKAIKLPDVKEIEGIDYNIPEVVLMQEFSKGRI